MNDDTSRVLLSLIHTQRTAALATQEEGWPRIAHVPFALAADGSGFLIHVSLLAAHTRDLMRDPRVALMVAEPDQGDARNPQTLARLSIQGMAERVAPDAPEYSELRAAYVRRLPKAELTFQLGDFHLFRIRPEACRFVAGFAQAFDVSVDDLASLIAAAEGP